MFEYVEKGPQRACAICGTRTNKIEVESGCNCCSQTCARELKKENLTSDYDDIDNVEEEFLEEED